MHLKQKGYYLGVFLIYTIITITLPSVGWCEPTTYSSQPNSDLAPHNDRKSDLTTHPFNREDRKRQHLDSGRQGEEYRTSRVFDNFKNRDRIQSDQRLRHRMASSSSDKSLENLNKPKQTEVERMYSSLSPPSENCGAGKIKHVINGKFYISGQLETNVPHVGYQSDSAFPVQAHKGRAWIRGQRLSGSEESWQKLQPVVECGDDTMTLTVRRRRAVQLRLDLVNESSVPLSQLPPQCGYSVQSTWRDLSLMAQYDACHVTQEHDSYVLPLLWRGTPVKMSCPVTHIQPQAAGPSSLCCSPYVRGEWTPLVMLAQQCGYTLNRQDGEILITAPFITCGITVKDGKHTLSLQVGEKMFTLACPVSPPEELPLTHQPLVDSSHQLTSGPMEPMPETLGPFPWAPPFYLAPPYYPHPTYHHRYPGPGVHDANNPPTSTSSAPDPTFSPQPTPPVDSQPDYQDYYSRGIPVMESYKHFDVRSSLLSTKEMDDSSRAYSDLYNLSEKRSAIDAGFQMQVEAPSLQPPSHAFNPYYHYYHHPKIPLPGPPEDPDPGPEVPSELSLTNSNNPESPVLPPNVQQSEALGRVNSDQSLQPVPEAASPPYIPPTPKFYHTSPAPHAPHPPQPYPYHYLYYFPHIAWGEAKKLSPLSPNTAAKPNLSDHHNTKWKTSLYPLPHSSVLPVHDKYDLKAYTQQPSSDKVINLQKHMLHPLLSEDDDDDDDDVKEELDDKKRQSVSVTPAVQPPLPDPVAVPLHEHTSPPTPSSNHNPPPYLYYYHPYHGYYQLYYRPESLLSADNRASPTSSKEALDPLLPASSSPPQHPSYCKHPPSQQTTTPPTESMYDDPNGLVYPDYYYYHLYYQPKVSVDNQDPGESMNFEKETTKSESQLPSDSGYSSIDWQAHAAEMGYPSIPQPLYIPFHIPYFHYITQQHSNDPYEHPDGEEAEHRQDDERRDLLFVPDRNVLCCIQ
ncbi:uncharacterized protein LOC122966203 isoform X2 [Thunnus albacares]|uniref:uncharacterized protein LOC122966203 isoform X2 n=1 Tax=Thunnus albacares TaxID=8236 RepID=UPI001CF68A4D|nr:uncharacterized protein LOC122966203 isoform X2 [Thunnus albacares]